MTLWTARAGLAALGTVVAVVVAGCGDVNGPRDARDNAGDTLGNIRDTTPHGAADVISRGGGTTCAEYIEQNLEVQRAIVAEFLKHEGQHNPGEAQVDSARLAIDTMCTLRGGADTPIREAGVAGGGLNDHQGN